MTAFTCLHPAVAAVYFVSVMLFTMFTVHPVLLFFALLGGSLFFAKIGQPSKCWKDIAFFVVLFAAIALSNPLFSHNGVTPLFFVNGNPITKEALLYGVDMGAMVLGILYWFKCFNQIMTSDKLLFLLGKVSPKISLLLSSSLRWIPLLRRQSASIRQTQKAMGLFATDTWLDRLKGTLRVYSSLITWGLENAIDTGSAMKARGYGLKGRSHYSIFTFRKTDGLILLVILLLDGAVFAATAAGSLDFTFYPAVTAADITPLGVVGLFAFGALSLLPFILQVKEDLQWCYYVSKI